MQSQVPAESAHHFQELVERGTRDIEELERLRKEHSDVDKLLEELPTTLRREAMVPFGEGAFFVGELVHTNEVMCHVGDRYYIHRTAPNARRMLQRRIGEIDSKLENLRKSVTMAKEAVRIARTEPILPRGKKGVITLADDGTVAIRERPSEKDEDIADRFEKRAQDDQWDYMPRNFFKPLVKTTAAAPGGKAKAKDKDRDKESGRRGKGADDKKKVVTKGKKAPKRHEDYYKAFPNVPPAMIELMRKEDAQGVSDDEAAESEEDNKAVEPFMDAIEKVRAKQKAAEAAKTNGAAPAAASGGDETVQEVPIEVEESEESDQEGAGPPLPFLLKPSPGEQQQLQQQQQPPSGPSAPSAPAPAEPPRPRWAEEPVAAPQAAAKGDKEDTSKDIYKLMGQSLARTGKKGTKSGAATAPTPVPRSEKPFPAPPPAMPPIAEDAPGTSEAFSGRIIERITPQQAEVRRGMVAERMGGSSPSSSAAAAAGAGAGGGAAERPVRVSRFKQQKMAEREAAARGDR